MIMVYCFGGYWKLLLSCRGFLDVKAYPQRIQVFSNVLEFPTKLLSPFCWKVHGVVVFVWLPYRSWLHHFPWFDKGREKQFSEAVERMQ